MSDGAVMAIFLGVLLLIDIGIGIPVCINSIDKGKWIFVFSLIAAILLFFIIFCICLGGGCQGGESGGVCQYCGGKTNYGGNMYGWYCNSCKNKYLS